MLAALGGLLAAGVGIWVPFVLHGVLTLLAIIPSFKLIGESAPGRRRRGGGGGRRPAQRRLRQPPACRRPPARPDGRTEPLFAFAAAVVSIDDLPKNRRNAGEGFR